ncbi:MAG: threonine/serine dehydratase [Gemmatimonadota bacterium]
MADVTFQDVLEARERLAGVAHRTAVVTSRTLDERAGRRVFLKCENLQRGGAFKFRGAYNKIRGMDPAERAAGVLAYSSGNHAQGVALAASLLGVRATIVMPADAPAVKLAATRGYGAEVVLYDRTSEDRAKVGERIARARGLTLVPPYDDPAIVAGQGTAALELLEDVPDLDALVVPVSGGGLIAGSAIASHGLRPRLRVFGVEPESGDDTRRSLAAGERVTIPLPDTLADGLRVQTPGRLTFPIVREHVEAIVTAGEDDILEGVRFALLRLKLVVEPSGAVPLAALLAGRLPAECARVGLILSGGNLDPALLSRLWPVADGEQDPSVPAAAHSPAAAAR